MMTNAVFFWWTMLCIVSALNMVAWSVSAAVLYRRQGELHAEVFAVRRWQLILSAGYVLGCAYRSMLPVYDVPRLVLVDSWMSSIIIGRSVATVAELCFAAQWALLLREAARATGSRFGSTASRAFVPMILVAETCSWYSVLTTSNLGHVIEETIWGACALLLVIGLACVWRRIAPPLRPLLAGLCMIGLGYVGFMFLIDVPMYWERWLADEANGRSYLSLAQGLVDVSGRWVVSHRWADWQSEVVWMALYFSLAVWTSISLVHMPALRRRDHRA